MATMTLRMTKDESDRWYDGGKMGEVVRREWRARVHAMLSAKISQIEIHDQDGIVMDVVSADQEE